MFISTTNTETVADIQKVFHQFYPYLRINVLSKPHAAHMPSERKTILSSQTALSSIDTFKSDTFAFNNDMIVVEFEKGVWETLGLPIQVLRKSGIIWLQTSTTDDWSLTRQNEEGAYFSQGTTQESAPNYWDLKDIED